MRFLIAAAAMVVAFGADAARACSCGDGTFKEIFRQTDLVFEGVVTGIEISPGWQDEGKAPEDDGGAVRPIIGRVANFRVERSIKGASEAMHDIAYNIATGGNCGMSFEIGKRYRVFAYEDDGRFSTSDCSPTIELSFALDEDKEGALAEAERLAAANPDDPVAAWRPDAIRSEIAEDAFYEVYLNKVTLGEDADLDRMAAAFDAAIDVLDVSRAEEIARRAAATFPEEALASLMLARALRERDQLDAALVAAEQAFTLDPGDIAVRDEAERLRFLVRGEATPGRRDYRELYAKKLDARNCQAPKADFSGSAFVEADFSGAMLDGARFRRLAADNATFDKASLIGARFDEAGTRTEFAWEKNISGFKATFIGANLRGSSFRKAEIDAGKFDDADLRDANFTDATIQGTQFKDAQLTGARFGGAEFYSAMFSGSRIGAADFSGARAVNVSWRGADLSRARLNGADLRGGVIDCATKTPRGFSIKGTGLIPETPTCQNEAQNRDFSDVEWPIFLRLGGFDLKGANFSGGVFDSSEFQNADLSGADFSEAKGDANYSGANLTGASFRGASIFGEFGASKTYRQEFFPAATISGADFTEAKITAENFIGEDEKEASFSVAGDVADAIFEGAKLGCSSSMRDEIEQYQRYRADPSQFRNYIEGWGEILRERSELAERYLAVEGGLVRGLAARWPTMIFDENCQAYFSAGDGAAQ